MSDMRIDAALDWSRQKVDFEPDGSLRDIYIQDATVEDWRVVVVRILDSGYRAELQLHGAAVPMPTEFEAVFGGEFDENDRYFMSFTVGDIALDCHFFTLTEIEFSFAPNDVTKTSLRHLLAFMIDLGEATKKPVIMTPENYPQSPIYRYDNSDHRLTWVSPQDRRH